MVLFSSFFLSPFLKKPFNATTNKEKNLSKQSNNPFPRTRKIYLRKVSKNGFRRTRVPDLSLSFSFLTTIPFRRYLNEREPPSPLPSPPLDPSVERSLRFADRRDVLKRARRPVKRVPTHRSLYGHT